MFVAADLAADEVNRGLVLLLGVSFAALAIVVVIISIVSTRTIVRSNERLAERYEQLRKESLETFARIQREENARLVADTRAATAKMNVMADALWDGLNSTVRDRTDGRR